MLRAELAVVRPTGDPAGTVATRSAGLIEFSATLSFGSAEEAPEEPTLRTTLPAGVRANARCYVVETDDADENRREILGEILALTEADLGSALEAVLRELTIAAALSDAVLETRAARVAPVLPAPAAALQALALDVRDAGFPVRFAPTWTALEKGEIGLGTDGAEQELRSFLERHQAYRIARAVVGSQPASGLLSSYMKPQAPITIPPPERASAAIPHSPLPTPYSLRLRQEPR
jgi:hypothetical protein